MKSFKQFVLIKESEAGERDGQGKKNNNWKKETEHITLPKGFIPPSKMRPVIRAFEKSKDIVVHDDLSKPATMPKKTLYLVGGPVRDFVKGKSINDYDLATNATPEQVGQILSGAGFKYSGDRSGKEGKEFNAPKSVKYSDKESPVKVEKSTGDDHMTWFVQGRDNSPEQKVFVIGAKVGDEVFEIATFRKDVNVVDGEAEVDFVDDPREDAARRDLTINAMYIPLDKADKENKKLYDFHGGHEDLKKGVVKTVGSAEDRFEEDPLRVFRTIRFHCRFGANSELDPEVKKAIPKFLNMGDRLRGLNRIKDEFEKALKHPEIDPKCYIGILKSTKLLDILFPGVVFDPPSGMPQEIRSERDKILQVAWLLQHNPMSKIKEVLGVSREAGGVGHTPRGPKQTGWQAIDSKAVEFLLRLKDFSPNEVYHYIKSAKGTGLSTNQMRKWVEMFGGEKRADIKGVDPVSVGKLANYMDRFGGQVQSKWEAGGPEDKCEMCNGQGEINGFLCPECKGQKTLKPEKRGSVIARMESDKFKDFK